MLRYSIALLALPLLSASAPAQRYVLTSADSAVSAKVPFFGIASKTAQFPKVSGTASVPSADPANLKLDVTLDATALQAPDSVTLSRLRGPKFFWVEKYPTVTFRGQGIALTDDRSGKVSGELTARGVTRPVTLSVTFDTPPAQIGPNEPLGLKATTTIDRRDFGMKSYSLIVGKMVDITIRTTLRPD